MTITKGEPWGEAFEGRYPTLVALDDADLARLADAQRTVDATKQPILVGPGDVAATIGVDVTMAASSDGAAIYHAYPMDLGLVSLGHTPGQTERTLPFVAHVTGHRHRSRLVSPWPELIVMNTPLAAGLRLGPRAHPNDGKLDVTIGALRWREGREARRRAPTGAHLPHPDLEHRRRPEFEVTPTRRLHVSVDGVEVGRWSWVAVNVVADAFTLVARVG